MHTGLRCLVFAVGVATVATAQGTVFEHVTLRVASVRPDGAVVVDRGRRDQVQAGDRVVFAPRNGQVVHGAVTSVEDRTALVELVDRSVVLAIGTKGEVLVPQTRRQPATTPPTPGDPPPTPPSDDEWRPGMPLLGSTRPPRPEVRRTTVTGRAYAAADLVHTLGSFSQSFLRAGGEVDVDNVHEDGGTLRFAGEFALLTETSEYEGSDLRLFEISYAHGGTRFEPLRWQVGRFLQHDMPEFGLLDGAEVGFRRENGDRFGGSLGFLPELDEDLESAADLQLAGWYLGTSDLSERLTWGFAVQKSWHRFDADRDLVVAKVRSLPIDDWALAATVWLDLYTGRDDGKGRGVGLTRANGFASRRWTGSGGLELSYDHEEYPETLRRELPQTVQPSTLLDAHQDRISGHAFWNSTSDSVWHLRATGWVDEERDGGSIELGCEVQGLLATGWRTGLTGFSVQGLSSSLVGVRVDHGGDFGGGRLDVLYELGFVHHEGFPADRDDLLQHRLGALCTTDLGSLWNCTFYADATLWDEELSFGVGCYLQRTF